MNLDKTIIKLRIEIEIILLIYDPKFYNNGCGSS